jgi:hypothetical protein
VPKQPTKDTAALYLELPAGLRQRLDAFVERNRRKLKGEVANAIEQYLDREEAKERASAGPAVSTLATEQQAVPPAGGHAAEELPPAQHKPKERRARRPRG